MYLMHIAAEADIEEQKNDTTHVPQIDTRSDALLCPVKTMFRNPMWTERIRVDGVHKRRERL